MLRKFVGPTVERGLTGIAHALHARGITPNMLTLAGLGIALCASVCYAFGWLIAGSLIMLLAGVCDMLDGAVARASNTVSKTGAFTDSVVDRYADFFIFGGITLYYAQNGSMGMVMLLLGIVCGQFMVSYTRARAELVIPSCAVGFLERPERIIILALGSFFSSYFVVALWVLLLGTHGTALYRMWYTYHQDRAASTSPSENHTV